MQDIVRGKLAELVGRFGLDLCNDARRCEAMLRDVCGDHKREIVALVAAAREGVGSELRQSSVGVPKELIITRLAKRLHEDFGLVEDLARWAVESWAVALGVATAEEFHVPFKRLQYGAQDTFTTELAANKSQVSFARDAQPSPSAQPEHDIKQEKAVDLGNGVRLEMVLITAGEFLMGSPKEEIWNWIAWAERMGVVNPRSRIEREAQHRVRITRPFYLGKYPVTQEQWQAVMGNNPSNFKGPQNPVEEVSWADCEQFLDKLNANVGRGKFSLPSEAQWEYACRAGSTTVYCFGDDEPRLGDYAWYDENSGKMTHPAGKKKPNAWGLYDMHGNVWEWCQDWYWDWGDDLYHPGYYAESPIDDPAGPAGPAYRPFRVVRGGSWTYPAGCCRSANRSYFEPGLRRSYLGFRISRVPAE